MLTFAGGRASIVETVDIVLIEPLSSRSFSNVVEFIQARHEGEGAMGINDMYTL